MEKFNLLLKRRGGFESQASIKSINVIKIRFMMSISRWSSTRGTIKERRGGGSGHQGG